MESTITSQTKNIEELRSSFTPSDKEKFMKLARNTISLFGSEFGYASSDSSTLPVSRAMPVTQTYPHIKVESMFLKDMSSMLDYGRKSGSAIFRKIANILIPDAKTWSSFSGATQMLKIYPDELGAAFEFVNAKRKGFLMKDAKMLINQMLAETRRTFKRELVKSHDLNSKSGLNNAKYGNGKENTSNEKKKCQRIGC